MDSTNVALAFGIEFSSLSMRDFRGMVIF